MNDNYWHAVATRDASFDGRFVYAVRSTGVYCRPSCPSRRPGRAQVLYFPQAAAAEQAGFRACLRCHPAGPHPDAELVERACRALEPDSDAAALPASLGVTAARLRSAFRRTLGITPRQYASELRAASFKAQVRGAGDVTEALYAAGYGSSSRLYENAGERLGMTPGAYRKGGRGIAIAYTTVACPLGRLLVARTARGICAVSLGANDAELVAALHEQFSAAELSRDSAGLAAWAEAIVRHLRGAEPRLDLPLDVRSTAFQLRVWEELRRIPYGGTKTYGEVARAIGRPTAARAVARACATNPAALVIPCHRVLPSGGASGGYRWGAGRKKQLLETEAACSRKDSA
jgi:AraC family transcriptional regulator of adaptative response/methylated-DNA-[protein]-cysteine methyltransferase